LLWANVPNGEPAAESALARIFPWLTKTRTSEDNKKVSPDLESTDKLVYWGTPRRIRLDFRSAHAGEVCDLTGDADEVLVSSWRQRPNGANYDNFRHPLTPYYNPKPKETMWLPVHPQPGGIGYRHFLGLVFAPDKASTSREPATTISLYRRERRGGVSAPWRLLAAGYDMDNMKARSFIEAQLPVFEAQSTEQMQLHEETLTGLIEGADEVASLLRQAVRSALFSEGAKFDFSTGLFSNLIAQFWQQTESAFYQQAQQAAAGTARVAVSQEFLRHLRSTALRLFDEAVPITASDHPGRVAQAARWFGLALHGYGKAGASLFAALGLEAVEVKQKTKRKSA
jgi:CRISPR system Cascade subunit CasA